MTTDDLRAKLFEDRAVPGAWRVERFDEDGACELAIFSGPGAYPHGRAGLIRDRRHNSRSMPTIDLDDDDLAAVIAALRRAIADDKFPRSPRLAPLRSALAKLDPSSIPATPIERPPMPTAPARTRGGKRARR
jgi:hypothetical protein